MKALIMLCEDAVEDAEEIFEAAKLEFCKAKQNLKEARADLIEAKRIK